MQHSHPTFYYNPTQTPQKQTKGTVLSVCWIAQTKGTVLSVCWIAQTKGTVLSVCVIISN